MASSIPIPMPELQIKAIPLPALELAPAQGGQSISIHGIWCHVISNMLHHSIFGITYHVSLKYDRHPYSSWKDKAKTVTPDTQALKCINSLTPTDIFTWWVSKHCYTKRRYQNWSTNEFGNKKVKVKRHQICFFESLQVNIWVDNGLGLSANKPSSGSLLTYITSHLMASWGVLSQ